MYNHHHVMQVENKNVLSWASEIARLFVTAVKLTNTSDTTK